MNELTIAELEKRWEDVLSVTRTAVDRHPSVYRQLKSLAVDIIVRPIDISDYLSTAQKLADLLKIMDPNGRGSIFGHFSQRISPVSIWQVSLLRMECKDLLAYLKAFDKWRIDTCHLSLVK